ncbi:RES family NAD+ phosphorylase [Spirosoma oryzicola]|uniref:RES family NAD+ phosphorylase n=1 Tax=Spirosoma oryzicola TaxID=2898794 RepID=UPI003CC5D345
MIVYRISGVKYIEDLSGYGASLIGGRWNREKIPVLYTGASTSLCAWEYWVHLKESTLLSDNNFARISIQIPDSSILEISETDLPPSWPSLSEDLLIISDKWLSEGKYLCMKVPSAVIDGDFNYIINPLHPLFTKDNVKIIEKKPYSFDKRAFNKRLSTRRPLNLLLRQVINKYFPRK